MLPAAYSFVRRLDHGLRFPLVLSTVPSLRCLPRPLVVSVSLAPLIGKVDLLKVGHHGCEGSSTPAFLQTLMPKICVFTTGEYSHNVQSRERIKSICGATQYFTARDGGILALLGSNGDIRCYGQIH